MRNLYGFNTPLHYVSQRHQPCQARMLILYSGCTVSGLVLVLLYCKHICTYNPTLLLLLLLTPHCSCKNARSLSLTTFVSKSMSEYSFRKVSLLSLFRAIHRFLNSFLFYFSWHLYISVF